MVYLGRHVSIGGSMDLAFDRAASIGCTAMQIFVTNPRGWKLSPVGAGTVAAFRAKAASTGIKVIAHMPYLPNIASPSPDIFSKSVESLCQNMDRCESLNIDYVVTHMGSHMGSGKKAGLGRVAKAVGIALDRSKRTSILLENEAGHMNSVGDSVEDLAWVWDEVGEDRLGFCLDTCHLFAAGYDIADHETLDRMFGVLDIKKVHALHLNDAKKGLGSHLDRHANIGLGQIGTGGLGSFLSYRGISSKIMALETPVGPDIGEAEEIALVRRLLSTGAAH